MALLRRRRTLRSAALRFAFIYAVLLALSATALAGFLWWATAGLLERQTDTIINADGEALLDRFEQGGTTAVILTIRDRLEQDVDDSSIYLFVAPDGRSLAGNLAEWPSSVLATDGFYELPVARAGVRYLARVHRYDLPGDYHLLVGRDMQTRAQLRRLLTDALLWAFVVVIGMATLGAFVVRGLFRRALANVSATATAIAAGDLTRRVRRSGRGDEFDQLADTVNDMLDRIARLMDGVRQVSNAIAHDLRTPITRARGRLEEAAERARTPEEMHAAIERAIADLDGIIAIFKGLLRIAESEAGSRRSAFAPVEVAQLLRDVAELYDVVAEEKAVRLVVDAPAALHAYGDRELIQQAVANLVDNAVKFSPPGSAVRLSGRAVEGGIEIAVADQGPGIPVAERARATERFFRGEAARSTPGSGLGLALVQAVAQLHGGRLALEDAGPGLLVRLRLAGQRKQMAG